VASASVSSPLARLRRASVAVVFGTRPEIIKLAGIIDLLGTKARTVFSGQHFDPLLSNVFFDELRLRAPDAMLGVGGRSRPQQLGRIVLRLEEQFTAWPPEIVVVQGDTNTALGGALATIWPTCVWHRPKPPSGISSRRGSPTPVSQ
jgi:UDP-N-acetylglucosamine 2-epimerase